MTDPEDKNKTDEPTKPQNPAGSGQIRFSTQAPGPPESCLPAGGKERITQTVLHSLFDGFMYILPDFRIRVNCMKRLIINP